MRQKCTDTTDIRYRVRVPIPIKIPNTTDIRYRVRVPIPIETPDTTDIRYRVRVPIPIKTPDIRYRVRVPVSSLININAKCIIYWYKSKRYKIQQRKQQLTETGVSLLSITWSR